MIVLSKSYLAGAPQNPHLLLGIAFPFRGGESYLRLFVVTATKWNIEVELKFTVIFQIPGDYPQSASWLQDCKSPLHIMNRWETSMLYQRLQGLDF